jgi:hypothetical protein
MSDDDQETKKVDPHFFPPGVQAPTAEEQKRQLYELLLDRTPTDAELALTEDEIKQLATREQQIRLFELFVGRKPRDEKEAAMTGDEVKELAKRERQIVLIKGQLEKCGLTIEKIPDSNRLRGRLPLPDDGDWVFIPRDDYWKISAGYSRLPVETAQKIQELCPAIQFIGEFGTRSRGAIGMEFRINDLNSPDLRTLVILLKLLDWQDQCAQAEARRQV